MQTVSFAGSNYNIPKTRGDRPWSGLSDFVIAAASKSINTGGGNFTLLADLNFGATFGLVSTYFKSRTANPATAGAFRLASADVISWRNNANGANIDLSKDASDVLKYNATKVLLSGAVVNADINAAAAIAYSKLNLATSIVNADINGSAAIAYSKLSLGTSIVNADIAAAAAIVLTKLAAVTASRALVSDGSGFVSAHASTTATEIGYVNGVTSAIQTQLGTKAATDLSNVASVSANVPMNSKKLTGLAAGTTNGDSVRYEQNFIRQAPIQATTTTPVTTTSGTFQTTNLSASITPGSASSRVKITVTGDGSASTTGNALFSIFRGASNLGAATGFASLNPPSAAAIKAPIAMSFIDSPATTSATTYAVKIANDSAATTSFPSSSGVTCVIILEEII